MRGLRSSSDEDAINEFSLEGEERVTPGINGHVLQHVLGQRCVHVAKGHGLSAREEEVLVLLVRGDTRQDMRKTLQLSKGTIKTHLTHIYTKLDVHLRAKVLGIAYGVGGSGSEPSRRSAAWAQASSRPVLDARSYVAVGP